MEVVCVLVDAEVIKLKSTAMAFVMQSLLRALPRRNDSNCFGRATASCKPVIIRN